MTMGYDLVQCVKESSSDIAKCYNEKAIKSATSAIDKSCTIAKTYKPKDEVLKANFCGDEGKADVKKGNAETEFKVTILSKKLYFKEDVEKDLAQLKKELNSNITIEVRFKSNCRHDTR